MAPVTDLSLQLLDFPCSVRSDNDQVLETCRGLFGRFLVADRPTRARLEILGEGERTWRVRDPILDAVVERPEWLPGILAARVLELAGNHVQAYDLFHGATLTRGGSGLMLLGESGFGKSTLTFALLDRGWGFLSDEVAAVARDGAHVAPFPKAIEVRRGAQEALGRALEGDELRSGKIARDVEELFPGCLSGGATLATVVFLDAREAPRPGVAGSLELLVHREVDGLTERLGSMESSFNGHDNPVHPKMVPKLAVGY